MYLEINGRKILDNFTQGLKLCLKKLIKKVLKKEKGK